MSVSDLSPRNNPESSASAVVQGYPGCPISSAGASGEVYMRSECSLTSKFRPALYVLEASQDQGSDEGDVDKNKCCTLCNMSFTSAVVAQSHYQGKIHAKRLKLLLGEQPPITAKEASPGPLKSSPETSPMTSPRQRRDSDRYCQLCNAWFNNPGMAQQHYDGKKHKKNAARADLLEQLGKTLDMGEMKGLKRSYSCEVCSVTLNSVAQYHAHLQGSKHQNK
ncbi:Zinc finger matrin-type protein 4 [Takifugu flavidus]|uniref:Zinc finger matrin-type protein 4 n=1 Tax=Takifugu flavidus TaxID=433684 RepID=A0A5C6N0A1_9TELE|nr:Zinc finger matrin-type protein 4 [Takifugu flavidus]